MTRYLFVTFLLAASVFAQNKISFDILTYTPPTGWAETKNDNGRVYTKQNGTNYCLLTLVKSIPSSGTSRGDFDMVWKSVIVDQLNSKEPATMGKAGPKDGWMGELGYAPFETADMKGTALMTTLTGNGKVVAVFALTNSQDFIPEIERFVDSISLPAIVSAAPSRANVPETSETVTKLIGRWNRSGSVSPSYADPASWGTAGSTKSRYQFNTDGTYLYTERTFRYSYQNIIVVKENGRYSVSGETLTVSPAKSTITAYAKAGGADALGAVVKAQSRPLEKISYRFKLHYFTGIQEWNLVLMADSPTQRDGQFSNNTTFQNAWYFDQRFTDNDLTAVRAN
jgi:hypothetical protein